MNRLSFGSSLSVCLLGCLIVFPGCGDDSPNTGGGDNVIYDSTYTANHLRANDYDLIPDTMFALVQSSYQIYYGHTSHGSQIITGLSLLADEDTLIQLPTINEVSDDLGHNGDTSWVAPTRSWLDAHPECNMVMWSWCGGASDNTEAGIDAYLLAMTGLEADYRRELKEHLYVNRNPDSSNTPMLHPYTPYQHKWITPGLCIPI